MAAKLKTAAIVFFLSLGFVLPVMPGDVHAESTLLGKLKFKGDLRLRSEYEDNKSFNEDRYRWRQRYRLRFGATAKITDSVDAGFRLASGSTNYPTTGNQTIDSRNFAKFDFTIDRAFARYKRDLGGAKFTLRAGKFGHPFWYPTEIIWDQDMQPSGLAETIEISGTGLTIHAAQYVIRETDRDDFNNNYKNGEVYAAQVVHSGSFGGVGTKVGIAYYQVSDPNQLRADAAANNSDFTTNKNFKSTGDISDFHMLNISAQVSLLKGSNWPLKVVAEYVKNFDARGATVFSSPTDPTGVNYQEEDTAWLIGAGLGTKKPGTLRFWLSYSQIEADAVVAAFNSDDLQQSNVDTIFPLVSYQISKNQSIYYDGYYQERNNFDLAKDNGNCGSGCSDTTQYRHRLNWKMSF